MSYSNYQLNQRINNLQNQINNLGPIGSDTLNDVLTNGNDSTLSIELSETTSGQTLLLDGTIAKIDQKSLGVDRNASMSSVGVGISDKITGYNSSLSNTTLLFGGGDYQTYITHTDTSLNITNDNEMNIEAPTVNMNGQVNFDTPPHSVSPILGNDLTTKSYVDTLIGNYGGNGLPLYFNIASANPNPITSYPINEDLSQTLIAVDATPTADYYTLQTTALGTDTLIATFTTPAGYPNTFTIPAGLWNMLIYGYASGSGGQLYYHFHLLELKSDLTTALIATSGFSSDVNATSSVDPDTYHASLSIVEPYILDSSYSRLIVEIYTTGTGMGGSVNLNTLFGGPYYSFITTSLSGGTSILNMNNNWSGENTYQLLTYFVNGIRGTTVETTSIDAVSPITSLTIGNIGSTVILKGGSGNSIAVDTNTNMTVKDQTALSNNSNVANTKYVDTAVSALSSVYQTITGMSAYLTTATALATYATIVSLSDYGAKAVANTWDLLQTFTTGINTYSISGAVASTAVSLFNTTTGTITLGSSSSTNRIGNLQISSFGLNPTTATNSMYVGGAQFVVGAELGIGASVGRLGPINIGTGQPSGAITSIGNTANTNKIGSFQMIGNTIENQTATSAINFGDNQTTGAMTIGTEATRSGSIGIGANSCAVNVGGVLNAQQGIVLSANKRITFSTNTANPTATSTILGSIYTGSYTAMSANLTSGADYVVSSITSVPIGIYVATGCSSITSSTAGAVATTPRIQIKNGTAGTYHGCLQLPTFTVPVGDQKTSMSCSAVLEVSAVSTIQLVVNAVFSSPAIRNTGDATNFNFRLVRIG